MLIFCGCSVNKLTYTPEESKELGFTKSSILKKPSKRGYARIYFVREWNLVGLALSWNVYYTKNPSTDKKYFRYKDADGSLGQMTNGSRFFADIKAGKPYAIHTNLEAKSHLIFTPSAGYIYCILGEVKMGWVYGRANLEFIDKKECEMLFEKYEE